MGEKKRQPNILRIFSGIEANGLNEGEDDMNDRRKIRKKGLLPGVLQQQKKGRVEVGTQ